MVVGGREMPEMQQSLCAGRYSVARSYPQNETEQL